MDLDFSSWLAALDDPGTKRDAALARLHEMLLRVAIHELYRRGPAFRIGGPELEVLACEAANDDVEDWERLPAGSTADPLALIQQRELIAAVQRAMTEILTDHQRYDFLAIVVNRIPMDTMVSQSGSNPGAIYKTIFDARRKIRAGPDR